MRRVGLVSSIVVVAIATFLAGACGGSRSHVALPVGATCALDTARATVDSASVVVTSPIDPRNAPRPTTWGERFAFDLAYETFFRVDCGGKTLGAAPYRIRDLGFFKLLLEPVGDVVGPRIALRSATEAQARDLIDAGVDLVLTDSPALAAYAATQPDAMSIPLGWDRTWVVVTPRQAALGLDSSAVFRSGLARDVVRANARPAQGPYWWSDLTVCGMPPEASASTSRGSARVAYSRDEPVARALAERLVALAGGGTTAVGLAPDVFASALKGRTELAYVMPLPRRSLDHCRAVGDLLAATPWLSRMPDVHGVITPLIDTRLDAVYKRGRLNLAFTWDSTVTVLPRRP